MKKKIMLMIGIIISLVTILSMYNISYADTCVHDWDYKNDSYHECLNCSLQVAHSLSWSGSATSEKHVMECSTCEYTTRRNHTASTPHFEANGGGANATHDVVTECSVCGYEMGRSENDCNFGSWAVSKTDYNKHYRSCNQCGYGYSADHSGTWTTTTYATCTTTGLKERYCSTCGHTNQQVISKLGHDYSEPCPTCGAADMICSRNSNHKIDHECHKHSYTSTVISYATCQETGEEKYTCSCGDSYTETIPKIPHDYSVNDYLYASTSQHYTKKCSMCSERSGLVSHTESTHFEALGGGANATHLVVTECTLCLGRLGSSEQECSFTEWELSNTDINEHYRYCTLCNYGYGEDHTYNVSSPTCTVAKYCTKCDYVAANALGHNYSLPCTACNTENVICSNNNSHELSHDCSIYVVPPTVTNHIWTGNTLRGVSTNENYTLSGNPTGLNVGVYTARATLKSGSKPTYRWNDTKTTEARDYSWTILDETIKITQHPTDVEVKSGETATFSVVATGTHLSYQWYWTNSNQNSGGTAIGGATNPTYSVKATDEMDGRYYYCVVSNNSQSVTTKTNVTSTTAKLTVWYSFSIVMHPSDVTVKKGETASFSVEASGGNPSTYTYQWYSTTSTSAIGSSISGATNSTYSITPSNNTSGTWYYCVVSNGKYELTSNRAKLVADITIPILNTGTASVSYANKNVKFTVPVTVTEVGEGFDKTTFTADDINVSVDGIQVSPSEKILAFNSQSGNDYKYTLTLNGVTGNGVLVFSVAAGKISDMVGNTNVSTSMLVNGITIDNVAPIIDLDGSVTTTKGEYINSKDTVTIPLKITEAVGMEPSVFAKEDINVRINGLHDSNITSVLTYVGKTGNDYKYTLTITGITKEGQMTIEIPESKIEDFATNKNQATLLSGINVIVDNTAPKVLSVVLSLDSYNNSSKLYPSSLPIENQDWTNQTVYAVVNAEDESSGIKIYEHSIDDAVTYTQMAGANETWENEMNKTVCYRVIDNAGNISNVVKVVIKIDRTNPKPAGLEMKENNIPYVYEAGNPATSAIFIKPESTYDLGTFQSGILKTEYTITYLKDGSTETLNGNVGKLLKDSGNYKIDLVTTDRAGNQATNSFNAEVRRYFENMVKVKNIHDEGSGVKKVTITAIDSSGNEVVNLPIDNPGAAINERIKLTEGTFTINVKIEDGVGLTETLTGQVTNN